MAKKSDYDDVFDDLPIVGKVIVGLVLMAVTLIRMRTWGIM